MYPPVDTAFYGPSDDRRQARAGFLVVSALVPYKRLDVAVDACRRLAIPLTIVGTGPEEARLRALAGSDVTFLGWRSNEEIRELYRRSVAALLPGVEDFGMVPVEAQACGCPVVALGTGGAKETIVDGETGVLVLDRSTEAFADGLSRVSARSFDETALREHALRFSRERFVTGFQAAVAAASRARASQPADRDAVDVAASRTRSRQPADREAEQ